MFTMSSFGLRTLPVYIWICIAGSACMQTARLNVLQPAQMKIPDHITVVAVADRSKPSNGWLNVLEGLVTGEAIGQDRRSRQQAMDGILSSLTRTPRFQVRSTGVEMTGSKAGVNLPNPLEWSEVERLCRDHGADALLTIESFDSDNNVFCRKTESKSKKDGKEIITVHYNSEQRTGVRMGWRLYDPKMKVILDEYVTNDYLTRNASGNTEEEAKRNLPAPVQVTRDVARIGGEHYGMRVAPVYVNINRNYYGKIKGYKSESKRAATFAKAGEWERAAGLWKLIAERDAQNNTNAAGRAAYNMAVAGATRKSLSIL